MNLRAEHAHGAFRIRVTDCGCGKPDCDTLFMFATTHDVLWLACGISGLYTIDSQVQMFLADSQLDASIPETVAHGVALFGLTWRVLTSSREITLEQMRAFETAPDWMMRVPVRDVWSCRRVVFGDDLTRVPRALTALAGAYVPEGPLR